MRIRYTGAATVRLWDHGADTYNWSPENAHTVDIRDPELAAELLTHPPGDFAIAEDDPLTALVGIGARRAAELALAGIASLEDLAALEEEGMQRAAHAVSASGAEVRAWQDEALARLRRAEAERSLAEAVESAMDDSEEE